jgi:hypothetical protein
MHSFVFVVLLESEGSAWIVSLKHLLLPLETHGGDLKMEDYNDTVMSKSNSVAKYQSSPL